ncbi:hypothetical protein [Desulfovirgula thermocuniculi]|uniref:hypothetical protein n=1 Tax=Desulfovirgula thermocuniculi TaxID=348842 RepID=UPI0012EC7EC2|nr:hypothetical protein [Desulfovirgula thermocuniculi]
MTGSKKRAQWKAYKSRQAEYFKKLIGLGCDPALKKMLYLLKDMLLIIPTEQLIKGLASPDPANPRLWASGQIAFFQPARPGSHRSTFPPKKPG